MTTASHTETLAAEYALGLLEGEGLAQAERLSAEDEGFTAAVAAWRAHLTELDMTATPVAPGSGLWDRITASVARRDSDETQPVALPTRTSPEAPSFLARLWGSLPVWRAAGLVGTAAALALALATIARRPQEPVYVAVLMTDAASPAAIVNAYRDGRAELIPLEPITVPEGKALQIWTLWDRERGPVSVGLLDRARSVPLETTRLPRTGADQLFEITLEPKQGSSTGRPTGPILMKGLTHAPL
jgi:anti-sigma-K factor RskA